MLGEKECGPEPVKHLADKWCKDQKVKLALHFHSALRQESYGHRQSILRGFSLSVAGLLAVLAGVLSKGVHLPNHLGSWMVVGLFTLVILIIAFMFGQRRKSNEALRKALDIERRLSCYEPYAIFPDCTLLPPKWNVPRSSVSRADILQFLTLVFLVIFISATVFFLRQPTSANTAFFATAWFTMLIFSILFPLLVVRNHSNAWPTFLLSILAVELAILLLFACR
jgi:FtsH-binding integral membrane protein